MRTVLSVLGGSSPFTCALFPSLANALSSSWPSLEIRLFGRSIYALELVAAHARTCFPQVRISYTACIEEALDGADVVLHQIRYGGLEGRRDDEAFGKQYGVPSDETLGPAGLRAGLRTRRGLEWISTRINRHAPNAIVLNLTNPLSLSTSLMVEFGVQEVVGLCELPTETFTQVCAVADIDAATVDWSYTGFNHRGFVYDLRVGTNSVLDRVLKAWDAIGINGIPRRDVEALEAIPTKYFRMFCRGDAISHEGRANQLRDIRNEILVELAANTKAPPQALTARDMPWYEKSVVPWLSVLMSGEGASRRLIVGTLPMADGLAWEHRVSVVKRSVQTASSPPPPPAVQIWIDRFAEHEALCLAAVKSGRRNAIRMALNADPIVTAAKAHKAVDAMAGALARV